MNPEVEAVKRRFSIEDVASTHTELKPSGHLLKGRCPFHAEKTPSFYVNPHTGRWRCFGRCATGWQDVIDFFGWLTYGARWNARDAEKFREVLGRLKGQGQFMPSSPPGLKHSLPKYTPIPKSPDVLALLGRIGEMYESELWRLGDGPGTPLAYLRSRGFTNATVRAAHLGYATSDSLVRYLQRYGTGVVALAREMHVIHRTRQGDRAFFRGRILFPDHDAEGRTIHLCGRAWPPTPGDGAPKYLSLKGFDKPLHGYAQLTWTADRPVFVVESPPDRLTLLQWGYDAVATLGTGLAPRAARSLANLPRPLIYVPHNDGGAGLAAANGWQSGIGKGCILQLPDQVKDVNVLGCLADGQRIFHSLLAEILRGL